MYQFYAKKKVVLENKMFRSQHEKLKKCANHRALLGN